MKKEHFIDVNGYSNVFFEWGGEGKQFFHPRNIFDFVILILFKKKTQMMIYITGLCQELKTIFPILHFYDFVVQELKAKITQ